MNWLVMLFLAVIAYFLFFRKTGVSGVSEVSRQQISEFFMNHGSIKPYPGESGVDFTTAFQNEDDGVPGYEGIRAGFDLMIDAIDGASRMYNIQKTVLTALIMTESQGDWNAVGDAGYWDFAQIKYVLDRNIVPEEARQHIREIFEDRSIPHRERRDQIRAYLQESFPEIYLSLPTRRSSFGSGQVNTWKWDTDTGHWSTFDIICRANSARQWIRKHNFHLANVRDNAVVEIYENLEIHNNGMALRNRLLFDPEFNVYVMAYLLNKNIDVALTHTDHNGNALQRDKWSVLAGLFKYKNGSSAPISSIREQLRADAYNIKDWWYLACIDHGDGTENPYMSGYDGFVNYFNTFNTHYFNLTGEYLFTGTELHTRHTS